MIDALKYYLDSGQDHSWVVVRKARQNSFHHVLCLFFLFDVMVADCFEDINLTPLVAILKGRQNFVQILAFVEW